MTDDPLREPLLTHPAKYGCIERERRFLLNTLPPELATSAQRRQITDHYLAGGRLRLRRVLEPSTQLEVRKLTQKLRPDRNDPGRVFTTTIYLTIEEYNRILMLDGRPLRKDRCTFLHEARRWAIDVFQGALSGLILAETELATDDEMDSLTPPAFASRDVTREELFCGGALAALTDEAAALFVNQLKVKAHNGDCI